MTIELSRTSCSCEKCPDKRAYEKTILRKISNRKFEDTAWLADIESLEWAVQQWKCLVIQESDIEGILFDLEIYDNFRE